MTILVAVKKNGRVYLGADRITTFGNEYATNLVNGSKIIKLPHAYLATSGYTLLDNVIEHLYQNNHKMMENQFADRAHVFSFFLDLFTELKKSYTLVDTGKDTYATMYNVFLVVTPKSIYGISNNLSVHEYERFAAKGAGSDYSQGCLYGTYDLIDDGFEICRLALEAACHFSIYCKEPLDILEITENDFNNPSKGYKSHSTMKTIPGLRGTGDMVAVSRRSAKAEPISKSERTRKSTAIKKADSRQKSTATKRTDPSKKSATTSKSSAAAVKKTAAKPINKTTKSKTSSQAAARKKRSS